MATIAERTGWRALRPRAVLSAAAARLPAEDAFGACRVKAPRRRRGVTIAVPHAARASPISTISIRCSSSRTSGSSSCRPGEPLPPTPISSSCPAPRRRSPISRFFARRAGTSIFCAHARRGGRVLGLCGGYQMLGPTRRRPRGIEGPPGEVAGPRPARRRDGADRRQDAAARRGRVRRQRRAVRRLRDACRPHQRPGLRAAAAALRRRAASTARSRRTGASRAPMCMGCSPTTASAPPGSLRSARRRSSPTRRRSRHARRARRASRSASRSRRAAQPAR